MSKVKFSTLDKELYVISGLSVLLHTYILHTKEMGIKYLHLSYAGNGRRRAVKYWIYT